MGSWAGRRSVWGLDAIFVVAIVVGVIRSRRCSFGGGSG